MKNLLKAFSFLAFALILKSCNNEPVDVALETTIPENVASATSNTCVDDLPRTRLINNGTITFDLQVINENDIAEITITDIGPGITTSWNEFQPGEILFSVTNDAGITPDEKVVLTMGTCMGYEIIIDSNNQITSFDPILF